jgi:hypothetical protein
LEQHTSMHCVCFKQMMKLMATQRRGVLYSREMLELVPPTPLAA